MQDERDFPGAGEQPDVPEDVHDNDFGPEAAGVAAMAPPGGASSGGDPPPPYSEANSADPDDVNVIVDGIKVPYDVKDPVYWFRRLEVRMQTVGIGSQFWKRVALEQNLPPDLCACIKEYLILEQSEANTVYSDCKKTILEIYGPKPEENVAKAQRITLTGTPSEAGKQIRELICQKTPHFKDCCCSAIVAKHWRDVLPPEVRYSVASFDLQTQFDNAMAHADNVYRSVKAVATASAAATVAALSLDFTHDVAAYSEPKQQRQAAHSRPRWDYSNRDTWGKPDKDWKGQTPPKSVCFQHFRFGRRAHFCRSEQTCPWRDRTSTRPQ